MTQKIKVSTVDLTPTHMAIIRYARKILERDINRLKLENSAYNGSPIQFRVTVSSPKAKLKVSLMNADTIRQTRIVLNNTELEVVSVSGKCPIYDEFSMMVKLANTAAGACTELSMLKGLIIELHA